MINSFYDYEKAKIRLGSCDITLAYYQELDRQLLEYRRANNIFEVGDLVVFNDDEVYKEESSIYKIFEVLDSGEFVLSSDECIDPVIIRHATPKEIKAGKKL